MKRAKTWTKEEYNRARPDRTPRRPRMDTYAVTMFLMPLVAWIVLR